MYPARLSGGGQHGPLTEPQLVPVQTLQKQQAQQETEPVSVAIKRPGEVQEALQVPRSQTEPPQRISFSFPVHHSLVPQRESSLAAGAHRHLRQDTEQEKRPGREAEEGGGGTADRNGETEEDVSIV